MRITIVAVAASFMLMNSGTAFADGDAARGATAFNGRCAICHSATSGGPSKIGPNLFGVYGRRAAAAPGYAYSPAMQKSGISWSAATLNSYITQPARAVPGNKMAFAGVTDAGTRADLIAYLASLK